MDSSNKLQESSKEPPSPLAKTYPNCEFMKYLQPSTEAVNDQQQIADEYEQIYRTLSSGVYETSDRQEIQPQEQIKAEEMKEEEKSESVQIDNEQGQDLIVEESKPQAGTVDRNEQQEVKYEQIEQQEQSSNTRVQNMLQSTRKKQIQHRQQKEEAVESHQQLHQSVNKYPDLENSQQDVQQSQEKLPQRHEEYHQNDAYEKSIEEEKQLYSSIHIHVEESITIPQNDQMTNPKLQSIQSNQAPQYQLLHEDPPTRLQLKNVEVILEKFSKNELIGNEDVRISIVGYEQQYFLTIETQLYNIEVHKEEKQYSIKRRYTDFETLSKLIRHHYPGYILYPFPEKNIESYKKLKLSMTTEQQKIVLIEKRLLELQKYLKFLLLHQQISSSIILQIFLSDSSEKFHKQINNLLFLSMEQQKQLRLGVIEENYNSIKKIMKSGLNFFNSYLSSPQEGNDSQEKLKAFQSGSNKNNELFASIRVQLGQCNEKLTNFSAKIERLREIYKSNSQISNIESNIDSVLKLSSKLSSSRSFYEKFAEWTQDNLIQNVKYYALLLRTIQESLDYRIQLVSKINSISIQYLGIGEKIQQKIQLFDSRFAKDWKNVVNEFDKNFLILYEKFNMEWKNHCLLMSKIWK